MGLGRGDLFPSFRLTVLKGDADRPYLDLDAGGRAFSIDDLKVDFLLVEVFSELCIVCREAFPSYNRLFDRINENVVLASRVKMIGMGVESRKRAIARFRKEHRVAFPLFADERGEIFGALGEPELPVVYLLKREEDKGRIVFVHYGALENVQHFVKQVSTAIAEDRI